MKTFVKIILFLIAGAVIYRFAFYQTSEQKEFKKTLAQATQNEGDAQLRLGDFYLQGHGVEANQTQAVQWYRKAFQNGKSEAAWKLAQAYLKAENLPEAASYLQVAADGNPAAQNELGRFYEQGLGELPRHAGQGLYWRISAAQGGNKEAQDYLEQARKNQPELLEKEESFLTDLKAARAGNGEARLRVAQAYQLGEVILADEKESEKQLLAAWQENQLPQAGYELAQLYLKKEGSVSDEEKGIALLGELAQIPYAPAQYALGERSYQEDPPNYKDAFAWFSNAAAAGYAPAQYMTGFMLMQGQGMTRSVPLSIQFFKQAAEQEYPDAQYVLGQIYYKGLGIAANQKTGKEWLERAAQNGSTAAQAFLETI